MFSILLIEDDQILQKMYQEKFQKMGYGVYLASDGGEGFEIAKKNKPDFILLDLMMPKISGITTLKMLKDNPETKNIPVAILSVIPEDDPIIEANNTLFTDIVSYWRKDLTNPSEIVEKVRERLESK